MPPLNRDASLHLRPAQMVAVAFSATLMLSTIAGGERQRASIEERSPTCAREWPSCSANAGAHPKRDGHARAFCLALVSPPADSIEFSTD